MLPALLQKHASTAVQNPSASSNVIFTHKWACIQYLPFYFCWLRDCTCSRVFLQGNVASYNDQAQLPNLAVCQLESRFKYLSIPATDQRWRGANVGTWASCISRAFLSHHHQRKGTVCYWRVSTCFSQSLFMFHLFVNLSIYFAKISWSVPHFLHVFFSSFNMHVNVCSNKYATLNDGALYNLSACMQWAPVTCGHLIRGSICSHFYFFQYMFTWKEFLQG